MATISATVIAATWRPDYAANVAEDQARRDGGAFLVGYGRKAKRILRAAARHIPGDLEVTVVGPGELERWALWVTDPDGPGVRFAFYEPPAHGDERQTVTFKVV